MNPQMLPHIEKEIAAAASFAKRHIQNHNELSPTFMAINYSGDRQIVGARWSDSEDRAKQLSIIKALFFIDHIIAYTVVSEAWLSSQKDLRPMDDPDRKEVLMILHVNYSGSYQHTYEFIRQGDTIDFTPPKIAEGGTGLLMDLLSPHMLPRPHDSLIPIIKDQLHSLAGSAGISIENIP